MLRKSSVLRILVVVIACVGVLAAIGFHQSSRGSAISDTPETREVMEAVRYAYSVLSIAYDQGDVQILADAFVDHPDYWSKLKPEQQKQIQSYVADILGNTTKIESGYLTTMQAKVTHRLQGQRLLQTALAKAGGRDLTSEEWQSLRQQNHGEAPSLPDPNLPKQRTIYEWKSIEITGDKALVVYDIGVVVRTAILVRIDAKWYVAGIF